MGYIVYNTTTFRSITWYDKIDQAKRLVARLNNQEVANNYSYIEAAQYSTRIFSVDCQQTNELSLLNKIG